MIETKSSSYSPSYFLFAVLFLIAMLACGCGSHPVTGTTIVGSIRVTADNSAISAGTTTQLHATSTSSAGQTSDVTSTVAWSSASPTVAVVGPTGVLTGMAAGNATITASLNGVSGALTTSVGAPAVSGLTLTPKSAAVFTRGKQAYTAFATYANNTSGDASAAATWSVTPASVATISGGVVTAVAPGSYTVTAVVGTQTATAVGTVVDAPVSSIVVTPANPSIAAGATQKFTATATYADGTTADVSKSFNWVSSDTTLLTIDANGLATAIKASGTVTVSGQFGSTSAKVTVTLTSAARLTGLVVTPTSSSIANGSAEPHLATASYSDGTQKDVTGSVTWSVVDAPAAANTVRANARSGDIFSAHAELLPQAGSGSPVVAVDQNGVDWAMSPGITNIQASMGGLQSKSVVIVTPATVQSLAITSSKTLFPVGSKQPMQLIGRFSDGTTQDLSLTASWVSSDPTVATIDSKGNATGVKAGKAQISASFGGLSTALGDLTVLPSNLLYVTIKAYSNAAPIGIGEQLQMIGTYSDGTVQDLTSLATWSSANPNVDSVESYGFIHPVGQGVTEITGTVLGRTATISLGVVDLQASRSLVTPATPSFALGTTNAFTNLATFSNGLQSDVSPVTLWTSSDPTVFTINSQGRAKAGKVGTATVTASLLGVTQTSFPVQVTGAEAWKVTVSPNSAQIAAQTGQQYQAIGFFNDGTVQDITGDAIWGTEDLTVARIDEDGLLYGIKPGTTHVVCTFGNQTTHYPVTVTAATLQSVAVSPANTELPIGVRRQFSLMGTFSDGTTQDLSATALWSSSTPFIVNVLGQGIIVGTDSSSTGSVSGQYGFLAASTSVNITNASLTSLALAPPDTTVRVGAAQAMTLTGTFSDGFSQVIDLDDVFVSSSPNVAQVLSSVDTAYAVGVGTTQITANYLGKSATTKSFKVLSNVISSLTLSPANLTIKAGSGQQLLATATYADGSTAFVSRNVKWTTSNDVVLEVDDNGFATARTTAVPVSVTVTATGNGATASFVVNVVPSTGLPATIVSAAVSPATASFAVSAAKQFVLTVTYSDGSTQDVTPSAIWTSSSPGVATVSSTGRALGILPGSVTIRGSFQGYSAATNSVQITAGNALASLVVVPTSSSIATGSAEQHTAYAIYTDGSQEDVTQSVTWSVGTPSANGTGLTAQAHAVHAFAANDGAAIASVDQTGVDKAMSAGTTTVRATLEGVVAQSAVIVTPATATSLAIRATRDLFPVGASQPIQLIGTFSDGTMQDLSLTGNWQSSNPAVATIDQTGLARGISAGNVVFTGSFGGLTTSTVGYQVLSSPLVSIILSVDGPIRPVGSTQTPRVTGIYADGKTHDLTALAKWESTDSSVYTINSAGLAFAKSAGVTQLVATVGGMKALVTVYALPVTVASISITPPNAAFAQGTTQQMGGLAHMSNGATVDFTDIGVWRSEDPTVLTIDANGIAKAGRAGTTRVTLTALGVTQESADIQVTGAKMIGLKVFPYGPLIQGAVERAQIGVFTGYHFIATAIFDDNSFQDVTRDVVWSTSDFTTASVDTSGFVIGMKAGTIGLSASVGGFSDTLPVIVTGATLRSAYLTPGGASIPELTTQQYKMMGVFSDGTVQDLTREAVWLAPTPTVADVQPGGKVIGPQTGVGSVSAQYGYFSASTPVTMNSAQLISTALTPANQTDRKFTLEQYVNLGTFDDGTVFDVSLDTVLAATDPQIAEVLPTGLTFTRKPGVTQITAGDGPTAGTTTLTVTSNVVSSMTVSPASATIQPGNTQQFSAIATFDDGISSNVTARTQWTSSNPAVLSIDANGLATAHATTNATTVTLTGTFYNAPLPNSTAVTTINVAAGSGGTGGGTTLSSLSVTPANTNLIVGAVQQFRAIGTYADGTTADVTSSTTWVSTNPLVFSIDRSGLGTALSLTGLAGRSGLTAFAGTATSVPVTASSGGASKTFNVNVLPSGSSPVTLTSVAVSPNTANFAKGTTQQFTLTGTYSDGSTQDLSSQATWTTSAASVGTISSTGLATGAGVGSVQFTGSYGGQASTTGTVSVTPATLASIAVTPSNPSFAKGTTQQFTVIGTYTDGTTQNLTSSSTYASSNQGVVSVTAGGLAMGTGVGSAQVTITSGGQTVTTGAVNVTAATLTSIAVTPSSPSFAKGTTQQFTVTGTYSDGTTQNLTGSSTYTSSNTGVVSVSGGGLATGTGTGSASVTISSGGQTVTTGAVSVTAATLASIAVNPSSASFAKGTTQQFTVTGTYTDGTTQNLTSSSTYTSSNTGVVSVGSGGLATGTGTGSASITISSGSQTVTTGTVQVTPATLTGITVNPTSTHAAAGTTVQLTVMGTYTDGSTADVSSSATWSSSDTSLATVNSTGVVTGVSPGLANIQAQVGSMTSSSAVRVSAATLVSTAISPSGASFAAGLSQKFTLTGTFSDGSTQDLSSSATWTTSDPTVATVSSTGLATGVGAGSVQFTASYGGQTATTPTVMVTPATLVSIAVTPSSPNFAKGTNQQFRVTGTYTDGSMRDLTSTATFASSDPTVVSISGSGVAQGLNTGSVQITVAAGGQTASTQTVTVTPATLTSVVITPNSPNVAVGSTQQFTATGTFSDGSTQDLSGQAVWTSSNPQVMTINQMGLASTFQVGGVQVSATINGTTVMSGVISVTPATLVSLSITPNSVQIAKGTVRQMTATGTYTDGSTRNLSSMATWTTSDGTVVTVDANGLATGAGIGSATLTATLQGKTASTNTFQVTAATLLSIAFNPANPTVAAGSSSQISVIGTYSDGSTQDLSGTALYSSSNTAVATISSTGVLSGVAAGSGAVTVQVNGVTSSFNVTVSNATLVSLAITPANPAAFAKGTAQQFTATGTYSDGTTQNLSSSVAWSSSNTSAFTVDQNGLATGTGVGSGQLTAVYQGQTAVTPSFQVTPATVSSLSVTPRNASIVAGNTQQYTATATYTDSTTQDVSGTATWSSSRQSVATISSTGFASAVTAGTAVFQAQYQGLSGTSSVTVTAAAATLQQVVVARSTQTSGTVGGMQQYTATAVYSDQSTQDVTTQSVWTSSNTAVATVNSAGLASLVSAGNTTIQAQFGGVSGSMGLTVTSQAPTLQSIAISPSAASVAKGLTQQFAATGTYSDGSTQNLTTQVSWQSLNTTIATIDNFGLATSRIGGSAQITANFQGQGSQVTLTVSAATLVSLALTPSSLNLANGTKQQIIATGTLSDGSTQDFTTSVNWSSTNTSNATVSPTGVVTVLSSGQVTITAQAGGVSRSLSVNVTPATATSIQLTPTSVTVPVGGVQQFQATAMFTDGSSQDVTSSVTYTTSNANVVTVDANGNLHGVGTGTATVTATLGSASTTTTVTITQVMLSSLAITPQNISLADGLSQQLTATGTFANGSTQDLTNTVTWTSSNPQIASVSSTGKVTVTGIGMVTVTATTDNMSATTSVTATAAAVTAISVSPASTTLAAGQTQQYAATATFTDGSQQTITSSANWSISDPTKGTISNSGSTKGFLTSSTAGMLNVVATLNGISGSAAVTVQPAALTVLRITPNPVSAPAGTTQQLTVTGSYTDGSTANLTASTTWTTNSASVATVNTTGLLQAIMPGSTTVQATVQGVSATDNVTVTQAVLNSIAVTPSATSIAKGLTQQLTAIGTYTDGSTANITSQVQWSSSSPSVATVSGTGLVSTLSTGTSTLTATLSGVSQTASLTVTPAVLQSIAVTAAQNSFALGLSLQLTAIGTYSDGTTQNLTNTATWTSSAPTVGMVSSTGLATGLTTGAFTARAAFGGKTGSLPLTVTAAVLQSIVVTPANSIIVNVTGATQFTATGHYSDGTTQNLTNTAHWTVSGPVNVGTINQQGQLTGVHVGVAGTVTAAVGAISGSTGFTVVGLGI